MDYSTVTKFSGFLLFAIGVVSYILPIIMSTTFRCTNRKWVILSMFIPLVGWILSFYLIYKNKKESKFYEDYGKNFVWLNIILYVWSILALFTPLAKVRLLEKVDINGVTKFNLSFFLGEKDDLIGNLINKDDYKTISTMICIFIIASIIGLIINLIFRDARKIILLGGNMIIQGLNIFIVYLLTHVFDNFTTIPSTALTLELLIIIVSVISIFVTIYKTSYVDNWP